MDKKYWIIALIVFLIALFAVRLNISNSTPYLTYDSYLELRSVDHIKSTGFPLRADPLRADGASRLLHPVFSYILAGSSLLTRHAFKVFPNLLMVLCLIPVYLLAKKLTESELAAMIAVVLAGTGPIFFSSYLLTLSAVPLALFLMLMITYLFLDAEKHLFWLILCTISMAFVHPLVFVLVLSLLAMMILLKLEGFGIDKRVNELFFFTLLLSLWFYVVVYKNVLFNIGSSILTQSMPLATASLNLSLMSFLYGLGVITFFFGAIGMYQSLFVGKEKTMYVVIAPIISTALLLVLKLLPVSIGIIILTPFLSILAAYGIFASFEFLHKTKFPWAKYFLGALLVVLFVFGSIVPALLNANKELQSSPTNDQVQSYLRLQGLVPDNGVVLTTVSEAYAVQYFSGKKTVIDNDLLLVRNPKEQINDIDSLYTARFAVTVIDKAEKLGAEYVLFSNDAKGQYSRDGLLIDVPECATLVDIDSSKLYSFKGCRGMR